MPFQIIRNDITRVAADAIVNTANPRPLIGGGTDSAIYQAAGKEQLLAEREKIGNIERGQAVSTPAFRLRARYIIHTVAPVWIDGNHGERETLHACYANSLALAADLSCSSIAFPMIATGVYGFPKAEALDIALAEIGKFLLTHEMDVTLVVFDRKSLELSEKLVGEIDKYIDEHAVGVLRDEEYSHPDVLSNYDMRRIGKKLESRPRDRCLEDMFLEENTMIFSDQCMAAPKRSETAPEAAGAFHLAESLEDLMKEKEDTFQERLFRLIDERGLTDVTVYKRANIDRKVFSKIRCNAHYKPTKKTAVAFAIALELDMPAMQDLLSRAEIAFSPSNKFDLIISYFVNKHVYDIFEINSALFKYGQPLLGY